MQGEEESKWPFTLCVVQEKWADCALELRSPQLIAVQLEGSHSNCLLKPLHVCAMQDKWQLGCTLSTLGTKESTS